MGAMGCACVGACGRVGRGFMCVSVWVCWVHACDGARQEGRVGRKLMCVWGGCLCMRVGGW